MQERQYKAFISYRHLPLDLQVAKKLHKEIETYIIPKELRTDGKKLGYVFRDNDELPISSNLSESIFLALDKTEYLIVVCTPETPKSKWVEREIQYFLETHDRDHLITILADGTPETSFPDLVTKIIDEDGNQVSDVEPLAANITADSDRKRKRLFSVEKLRIIAALIGCPFDSLYKREQRRKRRRVAALISAISAILMCFAGVLINSNIQIRKNYEKALHDQSLYLSSESLKMLDSGDRFGALWLAKKALPDEHTKRPLLSKAEYALGKAANIYSPPGTSLGPVSSFHHNGRVSDYNIDSKGDNLYSLTSKGTLYCWNNKKMKWSYSPASGDDSFNVKKDISESYNFAGLSEDKNPVIWSSYDIRCVSEQGTLIWKKSCDRKNGSFEQAYLCDKSKETVILAQNSSGLFVLCIDNLTGDIKSNNRITAEALGYEMLYSLMFSNVGCLSEDGCILGYPLTYSYGEQIPCVALIDTHTGEVQSMYQDNSEISSFSAFASAGDKLLFVTREKMYNSTTSFLWGDTEYGFASKLYCIDINTGSLLWERECTNSFEASNDRITYYPDLGGKHALVYSHADQVDVFDPETGAVGFKLKTDSAVVCTGPLLGGSMGCFTESGREYCLMEDDGEFSWGSYPFLTDGIGKVVFVPGKYWASKYTSNDIIYYEWLPQDPSFQPVEDDSNSDFSIRDCATSDKNCIFLSENYSDNDHFYLLVADEDTETDIRAIALPKEDGNYSIQGVYGDKVELVNVYGDFFRIITVDLKTKEYKQTSWEKPDSHLNLLSVCRSGEVDNTAWALIADYRDYKNDTESLQAYFLDESMHTLCSKTIVSFNNDSNIMINNDLIHNEYGKLYVYSPCTKEMYCVDPGAQKVRKCSDKISKEAEKVYNSDRKINESIFTDFGSDFIAVLSKKGEIAIFNREEELLYRITEPVEETFSVSFATTGNQILTTGSDGCLRCYDIKDGRLLGTTDLHDFNGSNARWLYTSHGFIGVGNGSDMRIISTEDWEMVANVSSFLCYQENRDIFWTSHFSSNKKSKIAYYKRWTAESLVRYADEILDGWEMSEEQKESYGID